MVRVPEATKRATSVLLGNISASRRALLSASAAVLLANLHIPEAEQRFSVGVTVVADVAASFMTRSAFFCFHRQTASRFPTAFACRRCSQSRHERRGRVCRSAPAPASRREVARFPVLVPAGAMPERAEFETT